MERELSYEQNLAYQFVQRPKDQCGLGNEELADRLMYLFKDPDNLFQDDPELRTYYEYMYLYTAYNLSTAKLTEVQKQLFTDKLYLVDTLINQVSANRKEGITIQKNYKYYNKLFVDLQKESADYFRKFTERDASFFRIICQLGLDRIKSTEETLLVSPELLDYEFFMLSGIAKALFTHKLNRCFINRRDTINFSFKSDEELQGQIDEYYELLRYFNGVNYPITSLVSLTVENPISLQKEVLGLLPIRDNFSRMVNLFWQPDSEINFHMVSDIYMFKFLFLQDKELFTKWFFAYIQNQNEFIRGYYLAYVFRYFTTLKIFGVLEHNDYLVVQKYIQSPVSFIKKCYDLVGCFDTSENLWRFFNLVKNDPHHEKFFTRSEQNSHTVTQSFLEKTRKVIREF